MKFGFIRLHYLMAFALTGAYMPFFPIFLDHAGLSDVQIGWVIGSYGVAMAFMPILAGHLADRHLSNRSMLALCYLGVAATLGLICIIDGGFWTMLVLFMLFSLAFTPLFSLLGGLTFAAMHEEEDAGRTPPPYHRIRLWGSWGFMLPSIALWAVLRYTSLDERSAIAAAALIALASAMLFGGLPRPRHHRPTEDEPQLPSAAAWDAVRRPPVRSAMGSMVLMFVALSMFYAFFPRYLNELGVASEWVGLIVSVGVIAEIICIWYSNWFVRRIGLRGAMLLGAGCMVARMALTALVPSIAVVVSIQILHGPVVMLLYVLSPMYLNYKAGRANRNSMQGLYSVLCFGTARLIGSIAGGQATLLGDGNTLMGLRYTFGLAAALSVLATLWLAVRFRDEPAEKYLKFTAAPPPANPAPET